MDAEFRARFDHMENALDMLVKSITGYSPSPVAAVSLVEADDELSRSLERLVVHQRNYQHLERLRATSESLDNRIKSTLSNLAETRTDLVKRTPVTLPPEGQTLDAVRVDELLEFAQRIARSTVPPTDRAAIPSFAKPDVGGDETNGQLQIADPQVLDRAAPASSSDVMQQQRVSGTSKAVATLPEELKAWLEPNTLQNPFTPWPSDDVIKGGALMQIEAAWEEKRNPGEIDLAAESGAEAENLEMGAE